MFLVGEKVKKFNFKTGQYVTAWADSLKAEMKEMEKIRKNHEKIMSNPNAIEVMDNIYTIADKKPQSSQASIDRINELFGDGR